MVTLKVVMKSEDTWKVPGLITSMSADLPQPGTPYAPEGWGLGQTCVALSTLSQPWTSPLYWSLMSDCGLSQRLAVLGSGRTRSDEVCPRNAGLQTAE